MHTLLFGFITVIVVGAATAAVLLGYSSLHTILKAWMHLYICRAFMKFTAATLCLLYAAWCSMHIVKLRIVLLFCSFAIMYVVMVLVVTVAATSAVAQIPAEQMQNVTLDCLTIYLSIYIYIYACWSWTHCASGRRMECTHSWECMSAVTKCGNKVYDTFAKLQATLEWQRVCVCNKQ